MSKIRNLICMTVAASRKRVRVNLKPACGLVALALVLGSWPARADGPDDDYLQIYNLAQQADGLNGSGKAAAAKAKYLEALTALKTFQKEYPDWNVKLVRYRLNDVVGKITALSEKPPAVAGAATTTNAPTVQREATAAPQTATTQVKLLKAGGEPRKVLRLHPSPGDKQTLGMTVKIGVETRVGEAETPAMKLPLLKITLNATVREVSDKGDITYELVVGDTSVSEEAEGTPEIAEAMKTVFAGVRGMSATGTMSSRGLSKGIDFKVPAGSDPQTRQAMDQMKETFTQLVVPLPEEAVGPGARWEVRMPIKSQGMTIEQTATYEVVSLEGERLATKSAVVQHAANQKVQNPAMPGLKLDLTEMAGKGTAELTLDLAKLLPAKGASDFHSETSLALNLGGQNQPMSVKMDLNVRFEAK